MEIVDHIKGLGPLVEFKQRPFHGYEGEVITKAVTTDGFIYISLGNQEFKKFGRMFCPMRKKY